MAAPLALMGQGPVQPRSKKADPEQTRPPATIREAICAALRREGYGAEAFDDGLRAWEAFERALPDVAILDIGVPRLDGLGALEQPADILAMRPGDQQREGQGQRGIGVTAAKRMPAQPDVPTFDELGIKGYEYVSWIGWVGPTGVPTPL